MISQLRKNARPMGIVCGIAAVALGIAYMIAAGAPDRYLFVNGAALAIGLLLFAAIDALGGRAGGPGAMIFIGLLLMATALFGISSEGATRWASLGPILLQPSLILLPMLVISLAQSRGPLAMTGIALAAIGLAIQPDRAMAGVLAAGLAVAVFLRPDRWSSIGFVAAVAGFAVTLMRPDNLPAMPYVDGIFYSAFNVHPLAGLAVLGGAGLLLVPAIVGWSRPDQRDASILLGIVWLAVIAAAALGNYPTPLVGYGGSAVIGYLLGLSVLPKAARAATASTALPPRAAIGEDEGASLAIGSA